FIWLTTLPFLLFLFYKAPIGQFLWNLIFIPFFSVIFYPALLITYVLSFFFDVGYLFNILDISIVKLSYLLNFGTIWYHHISIWQFVGAVLSIIFFGFFLKYKNRKTLFLSFLYFISILFPNINSGLNIYILSIGNGDAIVINFPNGKTAMIDAGPKIDGSIANRVIIPHLTYFGIDKIDYFFLSHPDEDHYGGIFRLVEKNIVSEVITSKFEQTPDFLTPLKIVDKAEVINIGSVKLYLFPEKTFPDKNNNSLIILLEYQNRKILFMGDAEESRESIFLEKNSDISNIDVLKIGHHGSKNGSSTSFLEKIKPKYSLISAGFKNRFGHPHKDTLKRVKNVNSEIFRTDTDGVIEINIETNSLKISSPFSSHKN
ncbi:MBL fold metallo-hydrolase, partial [bacterium]|nr:MBL fold metallo-hydrolase [bacterium]